MNKKGKVFTLTPIFVPFLAAVLLLLLTVSGKLLVSSGDPEITVTEKLLRFSVVQIIVYILPCIVYYFFKGRKLNTPFMISPVGRGNILFVFVSAFMLLAGNLLIKYIYYISSSFQPTGVDHIVSNLTSISGVSPALIIIAVALVPAVCEEIFFRGLVLAEYKIYGTFNAVVFSAICFAMIHFSVEAFPLYFFSGLVLGMTVAVTKSLFVSIAIHFISNVLSIYLSDSFMRVSVQKSGKFFMLFIIATLFIVSTVFVVAIAERIFYRRADKNEERPKERSIDNIAPVYLSPGFFGLVLVFVLIIILF